MAVPLILSLDSNGQPMGWVSWQDAVCYEAKDMVAFKMGEIEFEFHGGKSRETGLPSIVRTSSIIAVKGTQQGKKWHKPPALTNRSLFRRDQHLCAYCGHEFGEGALTRDHIIPVSKGGVDSWMNCVTACGKCNRRKGNKFLVDVGMELLYVPYVPNRYEYLVMQNRRVLADQMEFLKGYLPKHSRLL